MNFNLLLIRHAKSSWKDIKLADFDRPLNKRGMHNAPLMANRIRTYSLDLSLIISSPANRAMNTTILISKELQFSEESISYDSSLYHSSLENFINILSIQSKRNIALVGHNPGIHEFSYWLCSEPKKNFPTCGVSFISFNFDSWSSISKGCGTIKSFEYPKMFYEADI